MPEFWRGENKLRPVKGDPEMSQKFCLMIGALIGGVCLVEAIWKIVLNATGNGFIAGAIGILLGSAVILSLYRIYRSR